MNKQKNKEHIIWRQIKKRRRNILTFACACDIFCASPQPINCPKTTHFYFYEDQNHNYLIQKYSFTGIQVPILDLYI